MKLIATSIVSLALSAMTGVNANYAPPTQAPTIESRSHDLCQDFAVHARTAVNFDGDMSKANGGVGVYPGRSITGSYTFEGTGGVVIDTAIFASSVVVAHAAAIEVKDDGQAMAIEMGGVTFEPGTYRSETTINVASGTVVTLDGLDQANPVFLFQAGTLVTADHTTFNLIRGAKAENVIWALRTSATIGAFSVFEGSILAGADITVGTKAEVHGCALAQSAVTFESEGHVVVKHYS
jgi:hypothetical protein